MAKVCKIIKTTEDCFGLDECKGCLKEFDGEQVVRYTLTFKGKTAAHDKHSFSLCNDCFDALKRAIIRDDKINVAYVTTQEQSDSVCGLRDKRIDVPYATAKEMQSGDWVSRKAICEKFNISRANLDRLRRTGKIDARKTPGTEVREPGKLSYPHEGYLYNVKKVEEYLENRLKYSKEDK